MVNTKRIIIATISGATMGLICFGLASSGPASLLWPVSAQIIISRTLIGLALGLCTFTIIHWSIHGILFGVLFSLPLAFSGLMAPETPEFTAVHMFIATIVMGLIYGLLIEIITSVIFKAKAE